MNEHLFSPKTGKGLLLGLVTSLFLCSGNASAQHYIGGSFSFGSSSVRNNHSATNWTATTSLGVAPDLGWFIGDRWAVGIRPSVGFNSSINSDNVQSKSFSLGINPYARYQLLAHNRFGLWAEADPAITFTQNKGQTREGVWTSNTRSTAYGVDVLPVLTYQLNRRISLETRLHLFSLYLNGLYNESSDGYHQHSFSGGLRASTKDVMDTLGNISIGFLYKF